MLPYLLTAMAIVVFTAWFLLRKRIRILHALEPGYAALLKTHIAFYRNLPSKQQKLFRQCVANFFDDVRIEGVGTAISDTDRIMIAASAVIPVFAFPEWRYHHLTNVILYPDTFDSEFQFEGKNRNIHGMVGTGFMNGQMVLSRTALVKGFSPDSGRSNTAIHEFVHLVDKADGDTDGVPEVLLGKEYVLPWLKLMHHEMARIEHGNSDIDGYALTNEAEFLAVAAEYFFEKPDKFKTRHPELYAMMKRMFTGGK